MYSTCRDTCQEDADVSSSCATNSKETLDPDYAPAFVERSPTKASLNSYQQESKVLTVKKIKNIVRNQFALEMKLKEQEIETIDKNISQTKLALDRIRACVLARYYGMAQASKGLETLSWSKPRRSNREATTKRTRDRAASKNYPLKTSGSALNALKDANDKIVPTCREVKRCDVTSLFNQKSTSAEIQNSTSLVQNTALDGRVKSLKLSHLNSTNVLQGNLIENMRTQNTPFPSRKSKELNHEGDLTEVKSCISLKAANETLLFEKSGPFRIQSQSDNKAIGHEQSLLTNANIIETEKKPQMSKLHSSINFSNPPQIQLFSSGSRFYVKKRVIIGNTSKYIPPDRREENDKSTHKWMVYVRGPPGDPDIDSYVNKVWFFLHPSYQPNDIVEINKPPFHLTRRGWGEFPIRVQLHFAGSWNKRVDIIHELKLDKTYTGLQTLGAETVVDLEIDRKTFEELGIPIPLDIQMLHDEVMVVNDFPACTAKEEESIQTKKVLSNDVDDITKHMNVPNKIQVNQMMETSSALSNTSLIKAYSRSCSPLPSPIIPHYDSLLEKELHITAERLPLISSQKVVHHVFCASSVDEFFGWNLGKQRAVEWQRALKIRNEVHKALVSSKITTKEVMMWCRLHGYTPQGSLVLEEDVGYCKVCGRLLDDDKIYCSSKRNLCDCLDQKMISSTLSPALGLLKQVEARDKYFENRENDAEVTDVDIVSIPRTQPKKYMPLCQVSNLRTLLTPEEQWIRDVCSDIGVELRPEVMDRVEVNSVESALFSAMKQFVKQLVRTAVALSNDRKSSLDAKLIVPRHIFEAVTNLPHCDFLSNEYFGLDDKCQFE